VDSRRKCLWVAVDFVFVIGIEWFIDNLEETLYRKKSDPHFSTDKPWTSSTSDQNETHGGITEKKLNGKGKTFSKA